MPNTSDAYAWPYPNQTDVADVPTDMMELAQKITQVLDTMFYNRSQSDTRFQHTIQVIYGGVGNLPAAGNPGDVVFLIT